MIRIQPTLNTNKSKCVKFREDFLYYSYKIIQQAVHSNFNAKPVPEYSARLLDKLLNHICLWF